MTLNTGAVWSGFRADRFATNDADNGDGVESPFTFMVSGQRDATSAGDHRPRRDDHHHQRPDDADRPGQRGPDMAGPSVTFTIRNDGDQTLVLKASSFTDTAHFTVERPGDTTLTAGQTTTFTVTLNTDAVWSGSEQISFVGNDADNDGVKLVQLPGVGNGQGPAPRCQHAWPVQPRHVRVLPEELHLVAGPHR